MVILFSIGLFSSCTFFEREECETNADCFDTFGEGSICILGNEDIDEDFEGYCAFCETNDDCIDAYGNGATCETREGRTSLFELTEPKYCEVDLIADTRCSTSFPADIWTDWETYSDAIIVGQMFRGSADLSKTVATQIAVEKIQEGQSDKEAMIVSVLCDYSTEIDDGLTEDEAIEAVADHLADDFGANVIIGPSGSAATLTAIEHLDGRAVIVSPSATSDELTEEQETEEDDEPIYFWRTVAADAYQTSALIELIKVKGGSNIGVVYSDQTYGQGIVQRMRMSLGDEYTIETVLLTPNTDFDQLVGMEGDFATMDSIVAISSDTGELQKFMVAILEYQNSVPDYRNYFFTDSAARNTVFDEEVRNLIEADTTGVINRIWGTRPAIQEQDPGFIFFDDIFSVVFPESLSVTVGDYKYDANNNIYAAYSYDAMWIGALGALWSEFHENGSPEGISEGIQKLSNQGSEAAISILSSDNWGDLRDEFEEAEEVNISGASGDLDFDLTTNQITAIIEIWRLSSASNQIAEAECTISLTDSSYTTTCFPELTEISNR